MIVNIPEQMMVKPEKTIIPRASHRFVFIGWGIFFAGVFLFSLYIIQPNLIYHAFGRLTSWPIFYTGWGFFAESVSRPGGPNEYAAAFLSQWYYYPLAGATIITIIAMLLTLLTGRLIVATDIKYAPVLSCIPALVFLRMQSDYELRLAAFLALITTLFLVLLYTKLTSSNNLLRVILLAFMSLSLYYLAGGTVLLLILSAGFFEISIRRNRIFGAACIAVSALLYYLMCHLLDTSIPFIPLRTFSGRYKLSPDITFGLAASYLLIPACFFLTGLLTTLIHPPHKQKTKKINTKRTSSNLVRLLQPVVYLIIIASAALAAHDEQKKHVLKISDLAERGMWRQILDYTNSANIYFGPFTCHDIDLALYNCGRLNSDMFRFKQSISAMLLTPGQDTSSPFIFAKNIAFLMDLGYISTAEKIAFETLETSQVPFACEQLAFASLAKGRTETAKVFLGSLSKDLIYAPRAKKLLAQIKADPQLLSNSRVQMLRTNISEVEEMAFTLGANTFFRQLLEKNPKNKMAYEYMMAFYLLTGQTDKVVENLDRLRQLGYQKIPPLYEQALAIYLLVGKKKPDSLPFEPDPLALQQAKLFAEIFRRMNGPRNPQAAANALFPQFGNTYMYYCSFILPRQKVD
jgi:tetratricopeptide (TPR) repeat protein